MRRRGFLTGGAALTAAAVAPAAARARANAVTTVFHHPSCGRHATGRDHPEQPARIDAIMNAMRVLQREGSIDVDKGRMASEDELALVHPRAYIDLVKKEVAAGKTQLSTGDVVLSRGSFEAAQAAAGCLLSAVDAVVSGRTRNAFCAVRPPGHHASEARGMGFCLFNNIAIAARYAQREHGLAKVLIVDWDVHHGNGTQDIFWRDGSVLFFDTHQDPWYPGTGAREEIGEGRAEGLIMNRPFASGAGGTEIAAVYRDDLVAAADRFKPDLVLISAGFDSRQDDPLGQFRLTDGDYAQLTDIVMSIARAHAGSRVVSALEGGYLLNGLASASTAHIRRLAAA